MLTLKTIGRADLLIVNSRYTAASLDEVLRTMIQQRHSRLPVYEGSPEKIIGVLHYKDLLPVWEERRRAIRSGRPSLAFRIARLMREQGLYGQQNTRFHPMTTDSNHELAIAPNRLKEAMATRPNQIWVADITYVKTGEGWLFLAAIMDLYSRRIVGWGMSERIDTALVLMAWHMAREHRQVPPQLIFHSDRGVQYASAEYRRALHAHGALASMSRRACCYDNAAMESFWSTLKRELIYRRNFATHQQARSGIFGYIETRYNRKRRHSSLGYLSPVDFENQLN